MVGLDTLDPAQLPVAFGQLQLCRFLGEGRTGRVFEAATKTLGGLPPVVAVTVLSADRRGSWDERMAPLQWARRLRHPVVVQTFSCGVDGGVPFMVTDRVEGAREPHLLV